MSNHSMYDSLVADLSSLNFSFDVLCFTESWLTNLNKHLISFDGYNSFHCLREEGHRGGGGGGRS